MVRTGLVTSKMNRSCVKYSALFHHVLTCSKEPCLHADGNTKMRMSCTRRCFAPEMLVAHHKVVRLVFDWCLKQYYRSNSPCKDKDLSVGEEIMTTIKCAVEVNKETVVKIDTFQFNCKLFCTVTQKKNLPLPACEWLGPLSAMPGNQVEPGSNIKTQMLWDLNFVSPVHSSQCALINLSPVYDPKTRK